MPGDYAGSRVVMYNPITGLPMQYGSTGPDGIQTGYPDYSLCHESTEWTHGICSGLPIAHVGVNSDGARVRRACGELYYHVELVSVDWNQQREQIYNGIPGGFGI